jgi:hypothetical protein
MEEINYQRYKVQEQETDVASRMGIRHYEQNTAKSNLNHGDEPLFQKQLQEARSGL